MNLSIYQKNRQELRQLMDKINCPDLKELSNLSKVPQYQLYRLQCGLMPRLSLENLARLAQTLEITVGDFILKFIDYTGRKEHLPQELARLQTFENLQKQLETSLININNLTLESERKQEELRKTREESENLKENLREEYSKKEQALEVQQYQLNQQLLDSQRALSNLQEYAEGKQEESDTAIANLQQEYQELQRTSEQEREELKQRLQESESAIIAQSIQLKQKIEESDSALANLRQEYENKEQQLREREGELTLKLQETESELQQLRREYESLSESSRAKERSFLEDVEKQQAGLTQKIEETNLALSRIEEEYRSLQDRYERQRQELTQEFQAASIEVLESWLLQWPTAEAVARRNPQLSAVKLLTLVKPVMDLIKRWGVEQIHQVGERVTYDPQLHQLIEGESDNVSTVVVRYVGYRQGDNLLYRAKVSSVKEPAAETPEPSAAIAAS